MDEKQEEEETLVYCLDEMWDESEKGSDSGNSFIDDENIEDEEIQERLAHPSADE